MESFFIIISLLLVLLCVAYWGTPLVLIILGVLRFKERPEHAKKLFIIAGIMWLVGLGFCTAVI
jgi:hypothetical protein